MEAWAANVENLVLYSNSVVKLPPLENDWHVTVTPHAHLLTQYGTRTWSKKMTTVRDASVEACKRWLQKVQQRTDLRTKRPNLEAAAANDAGQQTPSNIFTLHAKDRRVEQRGEKICIWRKDGDVHVRRLGDDVDGVFFLDPVTLQTIRDFCHRAPRLVVSAYYVRPYVYIENAFEKKSDSWYYRYQQITDALTYISRVNARNILNTMPCILCHSREEVDAHMQMYKLQKINAVEVWRGNATYGHEKEII